MPRSAILAVKLSPPADVGPGRIACFDITTSNIPRSKKSYGRLFDGARRGGDCA
jgi:hypothetical protein